MQHACTARLEIACCSVQVIFLSWSVFRTNHTVLLLQQKPKARARRHRNIDGLLNLHTIGVCKSGVRGRRQKPGMSGLSHLLSEYTARGARIAYARCRAKVFENSHTTQRGRRQHWSFESRSARGSSIFSSRQPARDVSEVCRWRRHGLAGIRRRFWR
jgi:hypothetical protein